MRPPSPPSSPAGRRLAHCVALTLALLMSGGCATGAPLAGLLTSPRSHRLTPTFFTQACPPEPVDSVATAVPPGDAADADEERRAGATAGGGAREGGGGGGPGTERRLGSAPDQMSLYDTPREATGSAMAGGPGEQPPLARDSQPPFPEPEASERLHRRRGAREVVTAAGPGGSDATVWRSALATHLASLSTLREVSASSRRLSGELSRLEASYLGIAGVGNGIFARYVDYGEAQLQWIDAQLAAATQLAAEASRVEEPEMQLALLRLAGPRLEAAMMGSMLLAVWVDFLSLTDAALSRRLNSVEALFMRMDSWQKMLEPAMTALSSLEPEQVEAAARDMPALVGHLSRELSELLETMNQGAKVLETALALKESMEALTLLSALKFTLPALRAAAPITLGVGLMVGPNGVMTGTRMVVSAEWVEMMRQLVRAGVLSLPAVSAAVRIQAGQVMMAQGHGELPRGVREALGDSPEVRGMRVTGKTGAGMAEPPRHHVMPKEFRKWFEKRGFTGEMDIDEFCVRLEQAHHEAIHGGGDWRLGRTWPGEWNRMIMEALYEAETRVGRMLARNEILKIVAGRMKVYKIPMNFTRWGGR